MLPSKLRLFQWTSVLQHVELKAAAIHLGFGTEAYASTSHQTFSSSNFQHQLQQANDLQQFAALLSGRESLHLDPPEVHAALQRIDLLTKALHDTQGRKDHATLQQHQQVVEALIACLLPKLPDCALHIHNACLRAAASARLTGEVVDQAVAAFCNADRALLKFGSPQDLAACLCSLARLKKYDRKTFKAACDILSHASCCAALPPFQLVELLQSLLAVQHHHPKLLRAANIQLSAALQQTQGSKAASGRKEDTDTLTARQLCQALKVLTHEGGCTDDFLEAVSFQLRNQHLQELSPSELCTVAASFSRAGHVDRELFRAIASQALSQPLSVFSPSALTALLWSFAKLKEFHDELFAAAVPVAIQFLQLPSQRHSSQHSAGDQSSQQHQEHAKLQPQHVALLAWSFAKVGHYDQQLFHHLARYAADGLRRQHMAVAGQDENDASSAPGEPPAILPSTAGSVSPESSGPGQHPASHIASSAATEGSSTQQQQQQQQPASSSLAGPPPAWQFMSPQNLANLLYAFALVDHQDPHLMQALPPALRSHLPHFEPQHLANVLWALAVLQQLQPLEAMQPGLLQDLIGRAGEVEGERGLPARACRQLFQVALELSDTGVATARGEPLGLGGRLMARAAQAWFDKQEAQQVSILHAEVHATLQGMGLQPVAHVASPDGLLMVDISIMLPASSHQQGQQHQPEVEVAIEVDGPLHFSRSAPPRPSGPTQLQRRALARRFPRLLAVPFYEWQGLGSRPEREAYLRGLLGGLRGGGEASGAPGQH